jgi:hypothetical protein
MEFLSDEEMLEIALKTSLELEDDKNSILFFLQFTFSFKQI